MTKQSNPFSEVTDADLKGIISAFEMVLERLAEAGLGLPEQRDTRRSLKMAKREQINRFYKLPGRGRNAARRLGRNQHHKETT